MSTIKRSNVCIYIRGTIRSRFVTSSVYFFEICLIFLFFRFLSFVFLFERVPEFLVVCDKGLVRWGTDNAMYCDNGSQGVTGIPGEVLSRSVRNYDFGFST